MSEVDNTNELEKIVHQAFHDLANKYNIDVDTIAEIITDYDKIVSPQLEAKIIVPKN